MSANQSAIPTTRKRKRLSRVIHEVIRGRRFNHVIDLVFLSQTSSAVPKDDPDYTDSIVAYLNSVGNISMDSARRILPMAGLRSNVTAWQYVQQCYALPVFEDKFFLETEGPHALTLELLSAFLNDSEHFNTLDNRKELHSLASRMSPAARRSCANIILRIASTMASLCIFMGNRGDLTLLRVIDVINRYLTMDWHSPVLQSQYLSSSDKDLLVQGWLLANETLKVQIQEFVLLKHHNSPPITTTNTVTAEASQQACLTTAETENSTVQEASQVSPAATEGKTTTEEASVKTCITEEDLSARAQTWCHYVISEFFAWVFQFFQDGVEVDEFIDNMADIANTLACRLVQDIGGKEDAELPEDLLRKAVSEVSHGAPTMAEVHFDEVTMSLSLRKEMLMRTVKWCRADVLKRGRESSTFLLTDPEKCILRRPGLDGEQDETTDGTYHGRRPVRKDEDPNASGQLSSDRRKKRRTRWDRVRNQEEQEFRDSSLISPRDTPTTMTPREDGSAASGAPCTEQEPSSACIGASNNNARSLSPRTAAKQFQELCSPSQLRSSKPLRNSGDSFYTELTSWEVGSGNLSSAGHLAFGNDVWLKTWTEKHRDIIKRDVTDCTTMAEYSAHWKAVIMMEMRGNLVSALQEKFPTAKRNAKQLRSTLFDDMPELQTFRGLVHEVSHSKTLTQLPCYSDDSTFSGRQARELKGGISCMGYVRKQGTTTRSELAVIACRLVDFDDDEYSIQGFAAKGRVKGDDDILQLVKLKLTVNRDRFRDMAIEKGDEVIFTPLSTYSPYLRMYKAAHDSHNIPSALRRVLCSVQEGSKEAGYETTDITPLSGADMTIQNLEPKADPGCVEYLRELRQAEGRLNDSQHISVLSVLANIGGCNVGSSSLSLVQGPPGTGKTSSILALIGALLHHKQAGHVDVEGYEPVDALKGKRPPDVILHRSSRKTSLTILIACSSNTATDNIMVRIRKDGILGKDGKRIYPETARLARHNYPYGALADLSLNERALPYDILHVKPGETRKNASIRARQMFAQECIIMVTTLTTSGSPQLRDLKFASDIVIIDEAAHPQEPEIIIPVVAGRDFASNRRMHFILEGDQRQLNSPALCQQLIAEHHLSFNFDYMHQMRSLFERLHRRNRASCVMLLEQYRMHPCIANIHSRFFYNDRIISPFPEAVFRTRYNQGRAINGGYAPFTCIDTSECTERFELKEDGGKYYNLFEIGIIDQVLRNLCRIVGLDALHGKIGVVVPYRSQVDEVQFKLTRPGHFVNFALHQRPFGILIDTVDTLQGDERDIIIFAATRSNESQTVGFLKSLPRLNVAISRARKLLVFTADFSTVAMTEAEAFSHIQAVTQQRQFGSEFIKWKD